ncbi:MAG TPA: flagellar basal body L-ring protein FlgH [Phycisphaerae bacterium]|jgi:flagellar L-ring protein precursor FlgH|nr:flagellar basal body L-ring protein FlgH [Phycisphaerae bacterium]
MSYKTTMILVLAIGSSAFADLPGMPKAQDAESRTEVRPAVGAPTGPQRGSLFKQGVAASAAPGIAGVDSQTPSVSYIAVRPPEPKRYHKNDVLTVVIREDSDSQTNGQGKSKKTQDFDLALQQMLQLALSGSGLPTVGTVGSPSSLPEIKFKYSNDRQSDASQARSDSFSARLSATIVDVKPNGTLVVEAVKQIIVDKEEQTFKLTGVCRAEDIQVDNTVYSNQLANLMLSKQTKGSVHDNNKRGWLNNLIDRLSPF